jgi:response regulator RpfG family c-di-GMP phosphodiesterase
MTKIVYIDEQAGWQSTVYAALSDKYDIYIPETMPRNVSDIWTEVRDSQVVIVDFRLNESGPVSYTGDDVAREIHKHNKHLPIFIITSFEDNAIQECTEIQTIRGKEMFTDPESLVKLCHMIDSAVSIYDKKKSACEEYIRKCQEKLAAGGTLSLPEEADKFDAELYLSELDLDSSARDILISSGTSKKLEEMLNLARTIVSNHRKE